MYISYNINNNNDAIIECQKSTNSELNKMSICNYTSQINEIVRQLRLKDATKQLNKLKEIQTTIGLPKINKKMLERTEKNFYQLTTHLRLKEVPRTNNNAELTYNLSLQKSEKKKIQNRRRNNLKTNHIHEKQNITKSDRNVLMP